MAGEKKINPTMTLAQLYDAQKQYFDSFLIYSQLYSDNPNEDLKDRLDKAQQKIFSDTSLEYSDIISKIFNESDKQFFKIIPAKQFEEYKSAVLNQEADEIDIVEEDFDETPLEMEGAEEIEEEFKLDDFDDEEYPKVDKLPVKKDTIIELDKIFDLSVSDLSKHIIDLLGKDKKISDITLSEFIKIKSLFKDLI